MGSTDIDRLSETYVRELVALLQYACGDGIKEDIQRQNLITTNSLPTRIWDLLNTALYGKAHTINCIAKPTKRGPWQMLPMFERESGLILNIMREKRFKAVSKLCPSNRKYYYATCLAQILNYDLIAKEKQLCIPEIDQSDIDHQIVQKIVSSILEDLGVPATIVRHHALILFDTFAHEVRSVKCVIVDSALDIVEEKDWSAYLAPTVSIVSETIDNSISAHNNPAQGLRLTTKAKERKGQHTILPFRQKSDDFRQEQ